MHRTFFKSDVLPPAKIRKPWRPGPRKPTGERGIFALVWESRPHSCEICGARISEAAPWSFAHRWGKGTHGKERLNPANIALVCSMACHAKVDAKRKCSRWPDVKKF